MRRKRVKDLPRWHYTTCVHAAHILALGLIKPATSAIADGELAAVHTTTKPDWENTANKGMSTADGGHIFGDRAFTQRHYGLARIAVDPLSVPVTWADYVRRSGIPKVEAKALARIAKREGSDPNDWCMSFDPITSDKWRGLEVFGARGWVSVDYRGLIGERPTEVLVVLNVAVGRQPKDRILLRGVADWVRA